MNKSRPKGRLFCAFLSEKAIVFVKKGGIMGTMTKKMEEIAMKKRIVLLSLLAALCCLFTVSAAAADAPTSGTCGENLTWTLDVEGTLRISGTGEMEEYGWPGGLPWRDSQSEIKAVVIGSGVTTIGKGAFYSCTSLTSVTIPDGVTTIGNNAFSSCTSLTSITIPASVTTIGESAFYRCSSLTDVFITNIDAWCRINFGNSSANPMYRAKNIRLNGSKITSVTVPAEIADLNYTFRGFKDLIQVTLPNGLRNIGDSAFSGCSRLAGVNIPDSVTAIGSYAFSSCDSLIRLNIPQGITSIGKGAFEGCSSLISINIPEGVTAISDDAFFGCSHLPSINIPEGVTSIGSAAFSGCGNLISVDIPVGVTTIGYSAFRGCDGLTSITIPAGVTTIEKETFNHCDNLTSVVFSKNSKLTAIRASAFAYCEKLSDIIIPEGVITIDSWASYSYSGAFYACGSLTSINIPASVTTIGSKTFELCRKLTDVHISDLDAWCNINFDNENANPLYSATNLYLNGQLVEALEIPGSVSVIQAGLFRNAKCLKRVSIPRSLAGVAANAFENCTNITEVFYEGSESEWANLPISAGNDPLKNAQVYFGSTLENYYCRITVAVSDGGRVTVDHTTAKVGDTVTVTAAPYPGYELAAICVDGAAIQGDTFTVTGNHVVSARFTRVPVVGGNEDFRLEGISVRTAAGDALQELPAESLLVTVAVKHLKETGSGTILLAQYDSLGRYRGLMWLTLDEMPQGMTLRVILPVDNSSGEIANLKVFVVEDLTSPLPVGTPVSFGQV